jgi:thioredoxin reductase (NADPH)
VAGTFSAVRVKLFMPHGDSACGAPMTVAEPAPDQRLIPEEVRRMLADRFKALRDPVNLEVFTGKGQNDELGEMTARFVSELAEINDKIKPRFFKLGDARAKEMKVERPPTVLVAPEKYKIRYTGAPAGEEGRSFVQIILQVSAGDSLVSPQGKARLAQLKEKRHVQVFVTPTCPYCPGEVINAFSAAMERPDLVSAECVESAENPDLARKHSVGSVPHTVVNGVTVAKGLQPEDRFIEGLLSMRQFVEGHPHDHAPEAREAEVDLIIVGAGPAGLTAAIYAKRSGLSAVVLEKASVGGQVAITPTVENWPGFKSIPGARLMEMIGAQARDYVSIKENEPVREIKVGRRVEAITPKGRYTARGIILAMGAEHRKLGAPGEERLAGRGVSHCATCDGYFYKDRDVVVVGGGNGALTDALYLHSLGARVAIVHRKGEFRAERHLIDSWVGTKRPVIWDTTVEEIAGDDAVKAVRLKNLKTGAGHTLPIDGVFVSVGLVPSSELARDIGLQLDETGFIKVDRSMRTNIPRVYAAGDVTGGVRQIVTAVGAGATAAVSAFEDITSPYWKR